MVKPRESTLVIQFAVGKPNDWLKKNLDDFVWSLNKNLRRRKEGEAEGELKDGFLIVRVKGSSKEIIQPYLDSFVDAIRKDEQRFIVKLSESA